jgi:hypothetical protein
MLSNHSTASKGTALLSSQERANHTRAVLRPLDVCFRPPPGCGGKLASRALIFPLCISVSSLSLLSSQCSMVGVGAKGIVRPVPALCRGGRSD